MTPVEIIKADHTKNNSEFTLDQVLQAYYNAIDNPNVRITHTGDTMLVLELDSGEFHFVNAARFPQFVENVSKLLADALNQTQLTLYTTFKNPKILEVANLTPFKYTVSKEGDLYTMTVR